MYSFLFFSVTWTCRPPGLRSRSTTLPKTSSLTEKAIPRRSGSEISFSFSHTMDWWNSASSDSRSLKETGLFGGKKNTCYSQSNLAKAMYFVYSFSSAL